MTDAPKLLSREELEVVRAHGHPGRPIGDESPLARRVLALPDTGDLNNWYFASSITLAAAYLEARAHIAALEAERDAARAALGWAAEVYPDSLPWGGAAVEVTWDQFNNMRRCCGRGPLKPGRPIELRDAAYRRGLEDAAKVAEKLISQDPHPDDSVFGFNAACEEIAAAIRALKQGEAE